MNDQTAPRELQRFFNAPLAEIDPEISGILRERVDVALAGPPGNAGVAGPQFLRNVTVDASVTIDRVVRGNLGFRIAESRKCLFRRAHARVMQHQDVDPGALGTRIVIGRGTLDDSHHTNSL